MSTLIGAPWDPVDALVGAITGVGMDDLSDNRDHQVTPMLEYWTVFPPIDTLQSGKVRTVRLQTRAISFGTYRIHDGGLGGAFALCASTDSLVWFLGRGR